MGNRDIRPEKPEEFDEIYQLVKQAFLTAERSDGDEQDFMAGLRNKPGFLPPLALVALENGVLVGHIMLTELMVDLTGGGQWQALLLAPLAVELGYRGTGVGSALVEEGKKRAAAMGYKAIFLAGNPAYYSRFGFEPTWKYGIEYAKPLPEDMRDCIMVCRLQPDALPKEGGTVDLV